MSAATLLTTSRLLVRRFVPSDAEALYGILSDPDVMRCIEPPFSRAQTEAFLAQYGLCSSPRVYAIEHDGTLIGQFIWHACGESSYELGWILAADAWGRGFASELTAAALAYAENRGIPLLLLECSPAQTASARIAEKYGFAYKGIQDGLLLYEKSTGQTGPHVQECPFIPPCKANPARRGKRLEAADAAVSRDDRP